MRLYQGELARPRRSRGIITCSIRDLSSYASVVWPDYFWNYLNVEAVTVSSSKLFHKFIIRSEKKCWRSSVWKLFFFNFSECPLVRVLVSSSKKEWNCTADSPLIILYTSIKSALTLRCSSVCVNTTSAPSTHRPGLPSSASTDGSLTVPLTPVPAKNRTENVVGGLKSLSQLWRFYVSWRKRR